MDESQKELPTEWHHADWPMDIYPPAFQHLRKQYSFIGVTTQFVLIWMFLFILIALGSPIALYPYFVPISMLLAIVLVAVIAYWQVSHLRKLSWCVKHLEPESGQMRVIDPQANAAYNTTRQVLIVTVDSDEVHCEPIGRSVSDLYARLGTDLMPIKVWCQPLTGLPAAALYDGEIIMLTARVHHDWKSNRQLRKLQ